MTKALAALLVTVALGVFGAAQAQRIASPPGASASEVGGRYDPRSGNVNGRWLDVRYGRPLKRGRDLFGAPDFAEFLNDGAPVWRAGANVSTELQTETDIVIAGRTIPPGKYTLFIDLKPNDRWTLIVSSWPAQTRYDTNNKEALWGAYDYTPERDIVRAPMRVELQAHSFEQLSWQFLDMSDSGGRLALIWDRKLASVAFDLVNPRRSDGGR
jgi:hypothetical protein